MFDLFAAEQGLKSAEELSFRFKDKNLRRDDTAEGLEMDVMSIIEVQRRVQSQENDSEDDEEENFIELNLRTKDKKSTITLKIKRTDKMEILMEKYAEQTKTNVGSSRFIFDGEDLDPDETPESLDLDGGECIDVHLS